MRWGRLHVTILQYSWDPLILPADDPAWVNPGKGIVRVTVGCSERVNRGYPQVPEACRENTSDVAGGRFCSSCRGTEQGD